MIAIPKSQTQPVRILSQIPVEWRWGMGAGLIARTLLGAWGALIWKLGLVQPGAGEDFLFGLEPVTAGWRGALFGMWQRWDAVHYVRIAQTGYSQDDLSAFFPLFPILGRTLGSLLGIGALPALLLLSSLMLCLSLVLLYKLVRPEYSSQSARLSVTALVLFPTAFFLSAPYAEPLALFFCLLAFLAARRRYWLICTLAGLLAGLSQPTVLPLMAALLVEAWQSWKEQSKKDQTSAKSSFLVGLGTAAAALAPGLGAAIFLAWRAAQGFTPYAQLQTALWGWKVVWPWQFLESLPHLTARQFLLVSVWSNWLVFLLAVGLTLWGFRRLPLSLRAYQLCLMLLLLSTTRDIEPLASWGRHNLLLFPLFILLGLWASTPRRRMAAFVAALLIQLYLTGQFMMWGWAG